MFGFIVDYKAEHGVVPSHQMAGAKYKEYKHTTPDEPIGALCDVVIDMNLGKEINASVKKVLKNVEEEPQKAAEIIHQLSNSLSRMSVQGQDIILRDYAKKFKDEYEVIKASGGLVGTPYPWPSLTKLTGGLCPQQLVVLYGSSKSCKTWLSLYIALDMYLNYDKTILVITKEQTPTELARRSIGVVGRLPYGLFKEGKLGEETEAALFSNLENLGEEGCDLIFSDARTSSGMVTTASVQAKIESFNPDVVVVDGAYLLGDGGGNYNQKEYERITRISRSLKEIAQRSKVPMMITSQANRTGNRLSKTGSIAFSLSLIQDADLVLNILRNMDKDEIAIKIDAAREAEESGFTINAKVAHDFTEKSSTIEDLNDFVEADDKGWRGDKKSKQTQAIPNLVGFMDKDKN